MTLIAWEKCHHGNIKESCPICVGRRSKIRPGFLGSDHDQIPNVPLSPIPQEPNNVATTETRSSHRETDPSACVAVQHENAGSKPGEHASSRFLCARCGKESEESSDICKARRYSGPDPQDCDWPFCGCDPYASKVIEVLEESGALKDPAPTAAHQSGGVEADYHKVMGWLADLRMEHGKCQPRRDRACTNCNARDDLEKHLRAYRGPRIVTSHFNETPKCSCGAFPGGLCENAYGCAPLSTSGAAAATNPTAQVKDSAVAVGAAHQEQRHPIAEQFARDMRRGEMKGGGLSMQAATALRCAVVKEQERQDGWEQECADTDNLLRRLGLDPERCRTESGFLNVAKTMTLLSERGAAAAQEGQPVAWRWRRNQDGAIWSNWRGIAEDGTQITLDEVKTGPNVIEYAYTHPAAAQGAEDRRDAERYRWLRDIYSGDDETGQMVWCVTGTSAYDCHPCDGAELDAAIDAAMEKPR